MEKFKPAAAGQRKIWSKTLRMIGNGLNATGRPLLIAIPVLLAVWCVGRVMEALHGNAVFDISLTYRFGLVVCILLAFWVIGSGIASAKVLKETQDRKIAGLSWIFFLILALMVLLSLEGFRVSSAGLFAALAGSPDLSKQASFLLFKFHPANPMLAMNLTALKLMGAAPDVDALVPYTWSWNVLLAFFIWSFVYGILLLMRKDNVVPKSFHLFLAAFGLMVLIFLKSVSTPTADQMIMFQAAAPILLVFQVLLTYASLRAAADGVHKKATSPESVQFFQPEHEKTAPKNQFGLPPSAMKLALFLFLVLPILTDLQNQFTLSSSSQRIIKKISMNQAAGTLEFVTVTPVSIRSGPAIGDDIVGVLPEGTRIQVNSINFNWVNIGENKWVPEKFLRPLNQNKPIALIQKRRGKQRVD